MKANFHIHSSFSDGGKNVYQTMDIMANHGFDILSITDHNTVEGCVEALDFCRSRGIEYYHGVELTTYPVPEVIAGIDYTYAMHILGYGIDLEKMRQHLNIYEYRKQQMLGELIDLLIADGYGIRKKVLYADNRISDRTLIAKELIDIKHACSMNDAFDNILNTQRYVRFARFPLPPDETIDAIHHADGIAVWAHPYNLKRGGNTLFSDAQVASMAKALVGFGLDGMETYYRKFNEKQIEFLSLLADDLSLLKSTGSDYHGRVCQEDVLLSQSDLIERYTEKCFSFVSALRQKALKKIK
ncbi:MAG: PHP domain-containing protein [Bacteroidales bacterium]|nr:PHP domain-containing protein [Bacteroidales bacterium]